MQFSSRTLKIVRTFLDRGSVTKKNYLPCILVYLKKRQTAKLGKRNLLFYQQAKRRLTKQKPCHRHYEVVTSEVKEP